MSAVVAREDYAAHRLLGLELDGGWRVVEKVVRPPDATGENFSVGYVVERDGERAHLKALDFSFAFTQTDFTRVIEDMTAAFNFERDILGRCALSRMDRVVLALAHGQVIVEGAPGIPQVSYLIFEKADAMFEGSSGAASTRLTRNGSYGCSTTRLSASRKCTGAGWPIKI